MKNLFKQSVLLFPAIVFLYTSQLSAEMIPYIPESTLKGPIAAASAAPLDGLVSNAGLWLGANYIANNFYVDTNVNAVFTRNQSLRQQMPAKLPIDFDAIKNDIHDYIESINTGTDEQANGVLNSVLSEKIVRASFCFGTDAKMVAAKIRMESTFNHTLVSPTGAVGFTQMTKSGLEEANDQLGNRGAQNAPADNATYFAQAIKCYYGKSLPMMWDSGVIKKGQDLSGARLAAAKKWIQSSVDRDLVYGQIVLKVSLAASKDGSKNATDNYSRAFVRYNGDTHVVHGTPYKYLYARQVMGYFQNIDYDPSAPE